MVCPGCSWDKSKVTDSREMRDGLEVRRRRECLRCGLRWSTEERVMPGSRVPKVTTARSSDLRSGPA